MFTEQLQSSRIILNIRTAANRPGATLNDTSTGSSSLVPGPALRLFNQLNRPGIQEQHALYLAC